MDYKALLNFGEGCEIHVEDDDETETVVDGEPMTLSEWLESQFPHLDLLVLDLGGDALWYPYAVGEVQETVTGGFKEALPAEPWTLIPEEDGKGEIVTWHQRTEQPGGGYAEQTLSPEDLWHIVINKASARDKTGISEVLRNKDEITAFKENEQAINQAIELHGFPQRHIKVGKEDGAPVRDNDLRRVRTIFDPRTSDANTAYFTGQDVDVETLEAHQFDYTAIHEMDMRNLTTALGLPLEAGNVGADGLGSGKPAELRFSLLKLAIKANQRSFSNQFVEKVMRPVIRDYSPFDHTADVSLSINDPLEDIGDMADVITQVGEYMTNEQVADKLDIASPEDDEIAESYRSPADVEKAEEEGTSDDGPFGGMFSDGKDRTLASTVDAIALTYPSGGEVIDHDESDWGNFLDDLSKHGDVFQMWQGMQRYPEDNLESHDHATFVALEASADVSDIESVLSDHPGVHYQIDADTVGEMDKPDGWDVNNSEHALSESGTGNSHRCLGEGVTDAELQHAPEWDRPLLEMYRGVTNPDSDPSRTLVSFASSGTPDFVLERIRDAIMDGAMFSQFEDVPGDKLMDLRQTFADELGTDDFTLDSITESLLEFEADLDRQAAERIARTESSAVLNRAREVGYEERGEADELFYWSGADPGDDRQTEACRLLIERTNPFHGGEPVPMDELRSLLTWAAEQDDDLDASMVREDSWIIHINERSTLIEAPPNWESL
jgi:hypothetical protein